MDSNIDELSNVYLENDKIVAVTRELADFVPDTTIDATDLIVCPGLVDLNANILASVNPERSFEHLLELALAAGFTHIATNAFASDRCLTPTEITYFQSLSAKERAKVSFIGPLTQNLEGTRLNELQLFSRAGCIGFGNGDRLIANTLIKKRCYEYAAMLGLKIYITPEDSFLSQGGCMHEGEVSLRLGLPGIPTIAETLALTQELMLLQETATKAHINRLSAGQSVSLLQSAQENGLKVSADVAIPNLFLTAIDVHLENGLCHVRPPFRMERDRDQLREGIKTGIITAISSDHVALATLVKELPFQDSQPGIASWPVFLPLILRLAEEAQIPLKTVISCVTHGPATILGIDAGHLTPGSRANILIFDPKKEAVLHSAAIKNYGMNNPFLNWSLSGGVIHTIVEGVFSSSPFLFKPQRR